MGWTGIIRGNAEAACACNNAAIVVGNLTHWDDGQGIDLQVVYRAAGDVGKALRMLEARGESWRYGSLVGLTAAGIARVGVRVAS